MTDATETPISKGELTMRVAERELDVFDTVMIQQIRADGASLYDILDALPQCREASNAKTRLEEAVMWAEKAIAK